MISIKMDELNLILEYCEEKERSFINQLINKDNHSDAVILKEEDDLDLILFDLVMDLSIRFGFDEDYELNKLGHKFEGIGDKISDQRRKDLDTIRKRNSQNYEGWLLLQEGLWGKAKYCEGLDLYKYACFGKR